MARPVILPAGIEAARREALRVHGVAPSREILETIVAGYLEAVDDRARIMIDLVIGRSLDTPWKALAERNGISRTTAWRLYRQAMRVSPETPGL